MTRIAVVGLGNMGLPMAATLLAAGHEVAGYDVVPQALAAAREAGVTVAGSAAEAAEGADVVLTMLPSGRHVLDAYAGTDEVAGLVAAVGPGTLMVDCSTISVDDARAAHALVADAGLASADAPVSGGVVGAEGGTLTFMVGTDEASWERVEQVLEPMARRVVHCGDAGAGQAAKICNNMILGVSMIAVSEAFVLGERLGLSPQALFDVASAASGQCWALTTNCPVPGPVPTSPANRDFAGGFASALMLKDLGLSQDAARSSATDTELGRHAAEVYQRLVDAGEGRRDFSVVVEDVRARSH